MARFFRSRSLAAEAVTGGGLRVNGQKTDKPAQLVRPGDVLTFAQGGTVRLIRVRAIPTRRGPAPEARMAYVDLDLAEGADTQGMLEPHAPLA